MLTQSTVHLKCQILCKKYALTKTFVHCTCADIILKCFNFSYICIQ